MCNIAVETVLHNPCRWAAAGNLWSWTMNSIAKFSAIIALTALPLAGIAQAASVTENWPKQIDQTVANYKKDKFNVVNVDTLDKVHSWIEDQSAQEQASFRKALQSNPKLAKELQARNVEIGNVVGAEEAGDGSLTLYIR
jgi:hypothetical protein